MTTTLADFWQGFTTTTLATISGNQEFWAEIFIVAVVVMLASALFLALTGSFKRIQKRKW
jgi:hypothetical protein